MNILCACECVNGAYFKGCLYVSSCGRVDFQGWLRLNRARTMAKARTKARAKLGSRFSGTSFLVYDGGAVPCF